MVCSVMLPSYNRPALLRRAVLSVLAQDAPGLEVVVVDDCSPEETESAISDIRDPRFRYVRNEDNLGLFGNFNRCLELARGRYVRLLCTDDELTPGTLSTEIAMLERNPAAVMLSTRGWFVDAAGTVTGQLGDDLEPGLYQGTDAIRAALWVLACRGHNAFNYPSGILIRRDAVGSARFDESVKLVGDVDFWLQLAESGQVMFTSHAGSRVLRHTEQAGSKVMESGAYIDEWYLLIERWSRFLSGPPEAARLRAHIAAYALWFAQSYLRTGRRDLAAVYLSRAGASGASAMERARAVARMTGYKIQSRLGIRPQPGVAHSDPS